MPRIATLSLIPRAMIGLLRWGQTITSTLCWERATPWRSSHDAPRSGALPAMKSNRRRLPEVTLEAAAHGVVVADAEGHAHLGADLHLFLVAVGEVGHEAAALGEGDHAVIGWRIRRVGERVGGERHHVRLQPGHAVGLLAVDGMAVRVHADLAARELNGAADLALAADQAVDHVAIEPKERQRGLLVEIGANALLDRQHLVEGDELHVVLLLLAARQPTRDALALGKLRVLGRDLEHQRVDALAEGDDHDLVAFLGALER